jgi:hypothetical protein
MNARLSQSVIFPFALLAALAFTGCQSKARLQAQSRAAFIAGEQAAYGRMSRQQTPSVMLVGPVKNPLVPWHEGLTLGQAIVAAEYGSRKDPRQILIVRHGQAVPVDPKQLLNGSDVPLLNGDMVQIEE